MSCLDLSVHLGSWFYSLVVLLIFLEQIYDNEITPSRKCQQIIFEDSYVTSVVFALFGTCHCLCCFI